jgi:hypothetical protein
MQLYNETHNAQIKYCETEWLAFKADESRDSFNKAVREGNITNSYKFSKWLYGLTLMKNFLAFQRIGDSMLFVSFNNMAFLSGSLESSKEGSYLTASGRTLELLSHSPLSWLLRFDNYTAKSGDDFQVQAGWDKQREKLVLMICNRTAEEREITFDLTSIRQKFITQTLNRLSGDPLSMNKLQNTNAIKKESSKKNFTGKKGVFKISVPPYSFSELILE